MRAARVHQFGKALVVEDAPELEPQPDEVLVRVEACGVCHSDLHMIRGDWPDVARRTAMPATLGHEVVGRVVRAGAQVLCVLNASPFHVDKSGEREARMAERARQAGAPLLYAHLVGGQDEVVFDGASFASDAQGRIAVRGRSFESELVWVDIAPGGRIRSPNSTRSSPKVVTKDVIRPRMSATRIKPMSSAAICAISCASTARSSRSLRIEQAEADRATAERCWLPEENTTGASVLTE